MGKEPAKKKLQQATAAQKKLDVHPNQERQQKSGVPRTIVMSSEEVLSQNTDNKGDDWLKKQIETFKTVILLNFSSSDWKSFRAFKQHNEASHFVFGLVLFLLKALDDTIPSKTVHLLLDNLLEITLKNEIPFRIYPSRIRTDNLIIDAIVASFYFFFFEKNQNFEENQINFSILTSFFLFSMKFGPLKSIENFVFNQPTSSNLNPSLLASIDDEDAGNMLNKSVEIQDFEKTIEDTFNFNQFSNEIEFNRNYPLKNYQIMIDVNSRLVKSVKENILNKEKDFWTPFIQNYLQFFSSSHKHNTENSLEIAKKILLTRFEFDDEIEDIYPPLSPEEIECVKRISLILGKKQN